MENQRFEKLVMSFPSMYQKPGTKPWDALEFDDWASSPGATPGMKCTAKFLLCVWDPRTNWTTGPFNFIEAMQTWDPAHHAAFMLWAKNPWWP